MKLENKFYIYAYLDPRKKGRYLYKDICFLYEPIYIGKGHGNRYLQHLKYLEYVKKNKKRTYFKDKLKGILNNGFSKQDIQNCIIILQNNLSEQKAFNFEIQLIKNIGRDNFKQGPLTNLTEGGEGIIGLNRRGKNNPMFGKCHSFASKEKMAQIKMGKRHSPETKNKMSQIRTGMRRSIEAKRNIAEAKKGEKNPNAKLTEKQIH